MTSRFSRWSERHRAITQCDRSIDSVSLSVDSRETDLSLSRRSRLTYVVRRLVVFDQFLFKCVCLHSSLPHAGQSAAAVTSIIGDLILVVGSPGLAAAARRRWRRRNLLLLSLSLWCRLPSLGKHPSSLPAPTVCEETIGSALGSAQKVSPITALAYQGNFALAGVS